MDPKWFVSDPTSGSGPDFKEVSAPTPDPNPDPVSYPATLVSASRKLRGNILSFLGKFFREKKIFIYFNCACGWDIVNFFREVLFKFIPSKGWPDPDPKWFIPDPTTDPDPAKSFGPGRIRIHNTGNRVEVADVEYGIY